MKPSAVSQNLQKIFSVFVFGIEIISILIYCNNMYIYWSLYKKKIQDNMNSSFLDYSDGQ